MVSHGPVPHRAVALLARLDGVARDAETLASGLARRALGGAPPPHVCLAKISAGPDPAACFAASMYAGLRLALAQLGAPDALISEAVAHGAYVDVRGTDDELALAAALAIALEKRGVVLSLGHSAHPLVNPAMLKPIAIFATLLWLLVPRSPADATSALEAAVTLAMALDGELAQAQGHSVRLAALFAEFRDHV